MDVQLGLHVVQECAQQFGARLALLVGQAVEQPAREPLKGEGASASRGAAVGPRESGPTAREWAGLGVVLLAMFMSQIDMFIVNVAAPEIQPDLHAGFGQMQFVIDGYVIAYAAGMVTGGRLGDRVGRKKVFQWGVAAFTVTSLLCALSPSANTLIAARVLQGLSAALMASPQVLSILRAVFVHDRDRSRAVGAYGASTGSGVIAGLVGGGLLLDLDVAGLGWRMIFLLRLPPARRQVRHPRIDRRSHHHGRESV
ncbi:MFS transporter [Streptomyces sp. ET3-23]|uniref:MFS transporter n=1 Tax=Streptomyces sp. ET3-23 TaxID=2885643 RepID=UPI001D113FBE|nr:MFS transporter [Streptomyces sp. ET3-23]MCC2276045.1 MFS transporter [Streptomyces sp. ET3-23]